MDALHPGCINMAKVDFNYRSDVDYLKNYKELQKAFLHVGLIKVGAGAPWRRARTQRRAALRRALPCAGCWPSPHRPAECRACCTAAAAVPRPRCSGVPTDPLTLCPACLRPSPHRPQEFSPSALSKGKMQDNNEFMQWFYGYWQQVSDAPPHGGPRRPAAAAAHHPTQPALCVERSLLAPMPSAR